ncbi:MAG TPA: hypothetical protein VK756_03615 [Solirubrobacteraceae bacterium]|jgi:hypothetical protein|nr:hypothetical protein [Solirubrobacteraceae bacterium]
MSPPETEGPSAPVTLSDLLGALASDVTAARAQADAEAMRIARIYRGDPLLRTLPVPLFRLADLTISMPLAILAVPAAGATPPLALSLAAATVLALVLDALSERGGESGGDPAAAIARAIEAERGRLEREPEATREPVAIADALVDAALGALSGVQRTLAEASGAGSPFEQELRLRARARILALTPTPGVQIAATTAAIDAVGSRDSLVQLRVNLSERGVEWAIGEHSERLVLE